MAVRKTVESAIFSFHLAAERRFVVCPDGKGIVHQRDVGEAERSIDQRFIPAHLGVHRREQPVLAAGQRANPAYVAAGLLAWLVSSPLIKGPRFATTTRTTSGSITSMPMSSNIDVL